MNLLGLNISRRTKSVEIYDASGNDTGATGLVEVRENIPEWKSRGMTPERFNEIENKRELSKRAFEISTQGRTNASWKGAGLSINQEIRFSKKSMISYSRDLAQNDPTVKKFLRTRKKYIIGPDGFTIKCKAFDRVKSAEGKWTKVYDAMGNDLVELNLWNWSEKKYCSVEGGQTFRQWLGTVENSKSIDGEIFIKKIFPNKKENPYCYTLQAIEANMVDETLNMPLDNGNIIIMGIEYNANKKPQAYWFRKVDPLVDITLQYISRDFVRVPADEVIHFYAKEFVGQLRGYPEVVTVANRIRILKGYEEAALINARSAAMKTMVLRYSDAALGEVTKANIPGSDTDIDGNIVYEVTPGQVYVVPKGMESVDYNPMYPQGQHKEFTEAVMYTIASGLDMDYATLSSNVSNTNYTSIRHGMLDSRLTYKIEQSDIKDDIIKPVFYDLLLMSMTSGILNLPITKIDKFNQPKIIGYTGDWVDPLKDGLANIHGIDALTMSYEDVLPDDFEEHMEQIAYEQNFIKGLGLVRADIKGDTTQSVLNEDNAGAGDGTNNKGKTDNKGDNKNA